MNTHNMPFSIKKKIALNYPKSAAMGFLASLDEIQEELLYCPPASASGLAKC